MKDPTNERQAALALAATVAGAQAAVDAEMRHEAGCIDHQAVRPPGARTHTPSERTLARWAHTARQIDRARAAERAAGAAAARAEYRRGWRRGALCGAAAALAVAAGVLWLAGADGGGPPASAHRLVA